MIRKAMVLFSLILLVFLVSCTDIDLEGRGGAHAKNITNMTFDSDNQTVKADVLPQQSIVPEKPEGTATEKGGVEGGDVFDTSKGSTDENGCYDSEGGVFYGKRGYILDAKGDRYEDECLSSSRLMDVYCGLIGYKDSQVTTCSYGCENGRCLEGDGSPQKCIDSDFKDYFRKGQVKYQNRTSYDYCSGEKTLSEQFCTNVGVAAEEEKFCQYGCKDGACLEGQKDDEDSCIDSDFGAGAEFTKGTVTDIKGVIEDACLNSHTVKEYKCGIAGFRTYNNIRCEAGCVDGACVT